jgi:hypothetical protein
VWRAVTLQDYRLDFGDLLGGPTEWSVAYAVCYIHSEAAQTGLVMKIGSDDQAKIYLNEKLFYRYTGRRQWTADEDSVEGVDLRDGLNVLVFKVVNEGGGWQGSIWLADAADQPVKGIGVTLDPSEGE